MEQLAKFCYQCK